MHGTNAITFLAREPRISLVSYIRLGFSVFIIC